MQHSRGPSAPELRLPRDDDGVLAMLRTPPPPWAQVHIVRELCKCGRELLVRRAVEEGVVQLNSSGWALHAVAAKGSVSLLRYLVTERGGDPNQMDDNHCSLPFTAATIETPCI